MKDVIFIKEMLQRAAAAKDKVKAEFANMGLQQLNWKPTPDSWSIAECLDHLVVSDSLYFPALKKITEGKYTMTRWERWSPFSGIWGRVFVNQLSEQVKKKMKAPKMLLPSAGKTDPGILERFDKHQDSFLEYIGRCDEVDIDRINLSSPIIKFITYSLRNAIRFLLQHEHRHINQAVRVKLAEGFPK